MNLIKNKINNSSLKLNKIRKLVNKIDFKEVNENDLFKLIDVICDQFLKNQDIFKIKTKFSFSSLPTIVIQTTSNMLKDFLITETTITDTKNSIMNFLLKFNMFDYMSLYYVYEQLYNSNEYQNSILFRLEELEKKLDCQLRFTFGVDLNILKLTLIQSYIKTSFSKYVYNVYQSHLETNNISISEIQPNYFIGSIITLVSELFSSMLDSLFYTPIWLLILIKLLISDSIITNLLLTAKSNPENKYMLDLFSFDNNNKIQ